MYATVVKYALGPDTQWEADHIADVTRMLLERQRGFKKLQCLSDYENGEYVLIGFWDRMEDSHLALDNMYDDFLELIGDKYQWEPSILVYEVYEPKS